jgi:O-antigen ligase
MKPFARWVVTSLAAVAFIAPLKFGVPVTAQSLAVPPQSGGEWLLAGWPNQLGVIFIFAAFVWLVLDPHRMRAHVDWLFVLPLMFVLSQLAAVPGSIHPHVSIDTTMHFTACAMLFYAAAWYVRDGADAARIFGGLGLATALVCIVAIQQRAGGLQETRDWAANFSLPDELRARLASDRVFGTLVYPNALAGFLVVAFAPLMAWLWTRARTWHVAVKWLALAFAVALTAGSLWLTGSRGGLIAFAAMIVTGLWCMTGKRWLRVSIGVGAIGIGVVAMLAQGRGTGSLEARADYWRGAVAIIRDFPWLGTGPGTFGSIYPKYKTALTEEAQLVHNNFLQMWSDAGVAAFMVFAALWLRALWDAFRLTGTRRGDAAGIAIAAALAGWVVHGLLDFDLYVPGIAYPAFALLGALQGLKEVPQLDVVAERRRSRWPVAVACLAVVAAVTWTQGLSIRAGYALARGEAERAIELAPNDAVAHAAAGALAAGVGDWAGAAARYAVAAELDPCRASYHWRLGQALLGSGAPAAQALVSLRRAVELNPTKRPYAEAVAGLEESVRQAGSDLVASPPPRNENPVHQRAEP